MTDSPSNALATTLLPENPKFKLLETGITFDEDCPYEDWAEVGKRLGRIGRSVGLMLGDWINHGETHYAGKYEEALALTGLEYQTLMNFAYVARKVEISRRRENLGFDHHSTVAKLKPEEQAKWLEIADSESLGTKRLRKSINFGRIAREAEMTPDPADKGQVYYLQHINRFVQSFGKRTENDPVPKWSQELREILKRDLAPIIAIFNSL